jgi:hypothetical protein
MKTGNRNFNIGFEPDETENAPQVLKCKVDKKFNDVLKQARKIIIDNPFIESVHIRADLIEYDWSDEASRISHDRVMVFAHGAYLQLTCKYFPTEIEYQIE